ncbi:MAG: dihydrolipoyl dehydrogenase, partial [Dehalococcoidia bacterium]
MLKDIERARMMMLPKGMIKILADAATEKIVGATVLAPQGDHLIAELGLTGRDIFETVHSYPTL